MWDADLEERVQRDRAVVSDAHRNVDGVHKLADVVRVNSFDRAAVYSSGARKVSWQDLQLAPVSL